ncbi:hypothetical protein ACF8E6_10010 [Pseudomonas sp. xss_1]|uniref:DUF7693 family protein n=1 Tax=Pseudomonas sp. xss_1 TaxID=3367214 RepID=UPI00370A149A
MTAKPLTAREAYQILRDIALGVRTTRRIGQQPWAEIYFGLMTVEADGWVLTFCKDCDPLDYCDSCPVELLSTWEHAQLEKLLSTS